MYTQTKIFKSERPTKGIAVDCACKGNPGKAEYRGIHLQTGKILFSYEISGLCTNNIAEFAALTLGVRYLIKKKIEGKVYSDSQTALSWYRKKNHKSTLINNEDTRFALSLLDHSIMSIPENNHMYYVDFWNNKIYGETPADYGRK